jgi:D-alanine--D-alanine ligase
MRTPQEIATAFGTSAELSAERPFFLVGIGGAGMSSLAMMLKHRGIEVRGSDSMASPTTDALDRAGIPVAIGHANAELRGGEQVILSDAIVLEDSPEVAQAKAMGLTLYRRSQLLGWLLRDKRVIAVTGTHGKTTTTALIGSALRAANVDPTIVVGAYIPDFGAAVIEGSSDWAVVEACEAYDSFHDLRPQAIVLTNLELDHVDFHRDFERLKASVLKFVRSLPADGVLFYAAEDQGGREIAKEWGGNAVPYAAEDAAELLLAIPGAHNRTNAAGALKAAISTGASEDLVRSGLEAFRGAERRLQVLLDGQITVVDDYAHHPTEIRASLMALRERYPQRRLVVVYQPHLYSRTAELIPEFAAALSLADVAVLTDIYPAREEPMPGVSSARIAELTTCSCRYVPSRHLLPRSVRRICQPGDVVVGMGAGNISEFAPAFIEELKRPTAKDVVERGAKLRVAVLYGGDSAEREVSLHSGRAVAEALRHRGHAAELIDMTELLLSKGELKGWTGPDRPDVAVLAVHGTNAEDGAIQGLLELLHIPYSGSGVQASAIAMDKALTKAILERHGIRTPKGQLVQGSGDRLEIGAPMIVKPNAQGSTVGLSFVEDDSQVQAALERALVYGPALIEEWVTGMEISVPVLGDRALNPVEIAPKTGRYDFASKYLPGATEEIVPARMPKAKLEEAMALAVRCHHALGCKGATRTDMIVRENGAGEIVVLEVNTLPGMTATSLLPNSARSMGIEMPELCEWMALDAMRSHAEAP